MRPRSVVPVTTGSGRQRVWRPDWPCPVRGVLGIHRVGTGDPTYKVDDAGRVWRGVRTPEGPATLVVEARSDAGEVTGHAWGPGAEWVLDDLPGLLGADDDVSGFEPRHPVLIDPWRRFQHLRVGRSRLVWEALVPAVLGQLVTGQEAHAGFRMLVFRYGERAPGPGEARKLWVQPDARTVAGVPSWEWLRMHVDPARSRTLVTAARVADALERTVALEPEEADRRMRTVRGIGEWTSAEIRQRAHGDADAVSFGDYHVAKDVGWALTGTPFDDEQMRAYLEPWRPHRGRIPTLIALGGLQRPRRGARMAPRTHLPAKVTRYP